MPISVDKNRKCPTCRKGHHTNKQWRGVREYDGKRVMYCNQDGERRKKVVKSINELVEKDKNLLDRASALLMFFTFSPANNQRRLKSNELLKEDIDEEAPQEMLVVYQQTTSEPSNNPKPAKSSSSSKRTKYKPLTSIDKILVSNEDVDQFLTVLELWKESTNNTPTNVMIVTSNNNNSPPPNNNSEAPADYDPEMLHHHKKRRRFSM